jgi:hypothetical protein
MSLSLVTGAVWVVLATIVAMLPLRFQWLPGLALLLVASAILVRIGIDHGWWWVAAWTFAFVSMFRKPLGYFARRAMAPREGRA